MSKSIFEMTDQEFAAAKEHAESFQRGALIAFGVTFALWAIGTVGTVWFILS